MKKIHKLFLAVLLMAVLGAQADTLSAVKAKGFLSCGVSTGVAGFSSADENGHWQGFDVDICRAVAAATLGDDTKVRYVPLTAKERFIALQSGEIDLLSRISSWTLTRDSSLGLNFAGINYYDSQNVMVKKSLGVSRISDLDGATFCVQAGTTTELNLADYFQSRYMNFNIVSVETSVQSKNAFERDRCDALTSSQSKLAALKTTLKEPSSAVILADIISKEPVSPVVRQGDDGWFNIVRWSLNAMIEAEELGITSQNVENHSDNPSVQRLLGRAGELHKHLGLDKKWSFNIIKQVGNYAESFERNLGQSTELNIARGLNALWLDGGILYSPPFR